MRKFRNSPTECARGHKHPSKREAKMCHDLHVRQTMGEIIGLEYEPKFQFPPVYGRPILMGNGAVASYKPDFSFIEKGQKIAIDVKSDATMTEAFALRAALFRACWPEIELKIVK